MAAAAAAVARRQARRLGRKKKRGPANPRVWVLAGPGWVGLKRLQHPEGLGFQRTGAGRAGDVAQRAGRGRVTAGAGTSDRDVMVEVFGDGVVGRPPGSGDRGDGRRGHPQLHDAVGPFAAVPARGGTGRGVDLEQVVGEVADLIGVHLAGIESGRFGLERPGVAPGQFECVAGLQDGRARPAGVPDSPAGLGIPQCGRLGVGAHDADRGDQEGELRGPVVIYPSWTGPP